MKCHPITLTGAQYRVKESGKVGTIVPCPGNDPIILQFNKIREVFRMSDVEKVEANNE